MRFWKENNFPVALIPHKNGYKMFDPQTMSWQKVTSKVTEKFSPNAYCFYNLFPDKEITPKSLLRFALKQFDKHDLISLAILTFAVSVTSLFFPMIMGFILDEAIPLSQHNSMFTVGAFLLMFLPAQFIFYIMQMLIQVRIETKTCSTLQTAVWHRILHYKTSFFRKFSVGDLVSRINNTGKIQRVLQENFLGIIFSLFLMVINSAMMIKDNADSFATLDVTKINLNSGDTELLKSGASATLVCTQERVICIKAASFPLGIVGTAEPYKKSLKLKSGDRFVVLSDGIEEEYYQYIKSLLLHKKDFDAKQLADEICKTVSESYRTGKKDDITVCVGVIS